MDVAISPSPLSGTLHAVPAKSDAHRKLICAALSDRPTVLLLSSVSEDVSATINCLRALGADITFQNGNVTIVPIKTVPPSPLLDCGESGSTLRFLLPTAAALTSHVHFTGSGRLPDRPIEGLCQTMEAHGVTFSGNRLPFETTGHLHSGTYLLPGNVSSQYVTGLLLALPGLSEESLLNLTTPLQSAAYVDVTLSVLRQFGISIDASAQTYRIYGKQTFRSPGTLRVEGDWSNAAFYLTAGAIGAPVSLTGLDIHSPQGDRRILELLRRFGANVFIHGTTVRVRPAPLKGCTVDMSGIPDLLPILAVAAVCAKGQTRFLHAGRLRMKESDRLASVSSLLNSLGGRVTELSDSLIIEGGPLSGGTVESFHDHRIVMAAAIAAIRCANPVIIRDAGVVKKSYPEFFSDYVQLGGNYHVL